MRVTVAAPPRVQSEARATQGSRRAGTFAATDRAAGALRRNCPAQVARHDRAVTPTLVRAKKARDPEAARARVELAARLDAVEIGPEGYGVEECHAYLEADMLERLFGLRIPAVTGPVAPYVPVVTLGRRQLVLHCSGGPTWVGPDVVVFSAPGGPDQELFVGPTDLSPEQAEVYAALRPTMSSAQARAALSAVLA